MRRLFAAMLVAAGAVRAWSGDWTQWRGSSRDLIVTDEKLMPAWPDGGPQRLWQIDLPGEGYSEPAVVGGMLYVTGSTGGKKDRVGSLYALDVKDGSIKWSVQYGPEWGASYEFARTTPTVEEIGRASCRERV